MKILVIETHKMKATAKAYANIALIKYWGKRDKKLMLPNNSSISMTLSEFYTITTVEFNEKLKKDYAVINKKKLKPKEMKKILKQLDYVRVLAGINLKARIESKNNFPTAAGLASSASGLAALALASTAAAGLKLSQKELSITARLGSGSASRSILGGFVEWRKGKKRNGKDSYAVQLAKQDYWPEFRMLTTIVKTTEKKVSSTAGMSQTVKTSPLYKAWLETIDGNLKDMRKAIKEKNFELLGETAEINAIKMHSTMMTTKPRLFYWLPSTMEVIHKVIELREKGVKAYFTIDAGPNVKVICLKKNAAKIKRELNKLKSVKKAIECKPGPKAALQKNHLF